LKAYKAIYEAMKCSNLAICSMKCSKLLSIAVRKVLPESLARARAYAEIAQARWLATSIYKGMEGGNLPICYKNSSSSFFF
jgi:hypothetical protein